MKQQKSNLFYFMKDFLFENIITPWCNRYIKLEHDYKLIQSTIDSLQQETAREESNIIRYLRQEELSTLEGDILVILINEGQY